MDESKSVSTAAVLDNVRIRLASVRQAVFLAREKSLSDEDGAVREVPGILAIAIHGIDDIASIVCNIKAPIQPHGGEEPPTAS
jgi:hypothetical protein